MLITITGSDGCGKSTVTRLITEKLAISGINAARIDKWDIYNLGQHPECRFLQQPISELRKCISEMTVPARTLFLFWTMYVTMTKKAYDGFGVTLVDSYWIKHAASEQIYGASKQLINVLSSSLPRPDLVFVLDIAPEVAWERKARNGFADVVPYECGMDPCLKESSFILHQSKLRNLLRRWARDRKWQVMNAMKPPNELVAQIVTTILTMLKQ
jgi:dTMP kinase